MNNVQDSYMYNVQDQYIVQDQCMYRISTCSVYRISTCTMCRISIFTTHFVVPASASMSDIGILFSVLTSFQSTFTTTLLSLMCVQVVSRSNFDSCQVRRIQWLNITLIVLTGLLNYNHQHFDQKPVSEQLQLHQGLSARLA